MNQEELRQYCLSMPDVTEKMSFPRFSAGKNILAFYVNSRIFCFFDVEKFDECTVKCQPSMIDELKAKYTAIGKPFNFSPKEWIGIRFGGDVDDNELKKLIANSYDIVKSE